MLRSRLLRATARRPPPRGARNPPLRQYASDPATPQSRLERLNRRIPKFLHKYTQALGAAPVTHMTSFLILHELTAVIPLLGLAGLFHYTQWLPAWVAEGAWVAAGVERFGRYFRRKGWIGADEADQAERGVKRVDRAWKVGEGGVRIVVEFATAYAVVKMLLVPRIVFSVWATPAFARWTVAPVLRRFGGLFGKKGGGNGAAGGGAVPKSGSRKS